MSTPPKSSADETTREMEVNSRLITEVRRDAIFLVVVAGQVGLGKMFRLRDGETTIGRNTESDITIEDAGISRQHAKVTLREGKVELEDLDSRNGTFFGGERIKRRELADGDKFQLGGTTILRLSYQDALDEALQRNLYESATLDALTGLFNKRAFLDALDRELRYAKRHREPLSVLMLDVDFFKKVNDTWGHVAGDQVLGQVGKCLLATLRREDLCARFGGEEFGAVLRGTDVAEALRCGERLRAAVEALHVEFEGHHIPITMSIGVASTPGTEEELSVEAILKRADEFLYEAKRAGRNRVLGPTP